MVRIEKIKRDKIIGLKFCNTYCNVLFSLNLFKNFIMIKIIINEGNTTPKVERTAPKNPPVLKPINVLILTANGPGVDSEIPINSKSSSLVAQEYFKIYSFIRGIIAYPPPIVKKPILKNVINNVKNIFNLFYLLFCFMLNIREYKSIEENKIVIVLMFVNTHNKIIEIIIT